MGIVVGAVLVKVPQIAKIIVNNSVAGLSFLAVYLETISIFINLTYNFRLKNPFSTYGEGAFITVQNVVIMALIFGYSRNVSLLGLIALAAAFAYALTDPLLVPKQLLDSLQVGTIFIAVGTLLI